MAVKKKVLLPFEDHPYSLTYHYCAFPMGIIQANAKEDITPWLCGKYIDCWYDKNSINQFTIYPADDWATKEKILLGQNIYLYKELFRSLYKDQLLQFRKMLDIGFYVSGLYNEEHIPGKWAYQRQYYMHDFLLIGYDDIAKEFISVGYLADGVFQRFNIPYENMRRAVDTLKSETIRYRLWKYNPDAKFELNLERVVSELSNYLHPTVLAPNGVTDKCRGIDAMRCLAQLYSETAESASQIDIRYTRGVMEHKFFMQMRMDYLCKNKFLNNASYAEATNWVYQMAERVHMLALKFNFTKKQSLVDTIQNLMCEMLSIETEFLPKVLSDLQNGREVLK